VPASDHHLNKPKRHIVKVCKLSIDVEIICQKNYGKARVGTNVIKAYWQVDPFLVKISEMNMLRLFEQTLSHDEIFNFFHSEG